jgi:hypothetical protein
MSISSESAEQMTGMILKTEEVCLRVTGTAAKEIVALLAAILKDQKQTKGKTRLTNMLKSGKELKVFSVKQQDLKKFMQEAKRYGVLYSALIDKHNKNFDGMVDIMVRAEDASKINRIVERFKIATVNEAELRSEIEKTKAEKAKTPEAKEIGVEQKDIEVKEQEKQENAPIQKEEKQVPLPEKDSKKNLSKNSSKMLKKQEGNTKVYKKSVREDLKEIKEEMAKEEKSSSKLKNLSKGTKNKTKSNKKKDKLR